MKSYKKIIVLVICITVVFVLYFGIMNKAFAFNLDIWDTTWTFDRAIIKLADGTVIDCNVKSWRDYENSDQIQVCAEDGTTYLVHSVNCTLIT